MHGDPRLRPEDTEPGSSARKRPKVKWKEEEQERSQEASRQCVTRNRGGRRADEGVRTEPRLGSAPGASCSGPSATPSLCSVDQGSRWRRSFRRTFRRGVSTLEASLCRQLPTYPGVLVPVPPGVPINAASALLLTLPEAEYGTLLLSHRAVLKILICNPQRWNIISINIRSQHCL